MKVQNLAQIMMSWYKGIVKIHGRLKIADSWIKNHLWVLLKCVKLDSAQASLLPHPWKSEFEL
ncbi:hypothetical protein M8C21_028935 [Ambrosia artemisiifolia]|uniref:Uncharacterized protein n=1 Tax=Ambrosia artemisiifolia TaxID=4212 RepID=A0AAD5CYT2_AMBAR|nr:hypothetical protein M8C21_028935 [Ambrosia artemisiifolia]